ncbi:aminotransferase class I/II-fold pyridoxal phosphate-dependent enzyme [Roseitranquillus sediminis]|uniref:aminotransferase class I/II-fold pyridoxal phosphate-dependent enzyme n=1 Tax=Roseitranquillus sediminis TaxID=2809051 RepID=UPI001D0CB32F|nr:aminotransferase class I/II-fold pyridoxal phosphate-dependent enzyme [Roseitranquillus sediminis]MBM9596195.1 aminotransferase class I/II-fold pyridoxal phosphate-dependent enzyme [Roseitranquillus sediminis]
MAFISRSAAAAADSFRPVLDFFEANARERAAGGATADFTFGNPNEMPLAGLVDALRDAAVPRDPSWFAYKTNEDEPREVLARSLEAELDLPFEPEDIALTQGAFGAIALAFSLLLEPGDEVVIPQPGWFCYAPLLVGRGCRATAAPLAPGSYDLDVDAIAQAMTPRTRIVVVNSPANPTGRIYGHTALGDLAAAVSAASDRFGRRIFILSDEPYRRIRYDGAGFVSPAAVYPWTLVDYSYGKILLAPGQRLGYLALSPTMPAADRGEFRGALVTSQMALGWGFADALMQHALPRLETLSIDIDALASRRDRLLGAMEHWGYRMVRPEGTFYLWGRAPGGDAERFAAFLKPHGVRVMPGTVFDCPSDFRLCLTATDEMVERALPAFQAAAEALGP